MKRRWIVWVCMAVAASLLAACGGWQPVDSLQTPLALFSGTATPTGTATFVPTPLPTDPPPAAAHPHCHAHYHIHRNHHPHPHSTAGWLAHHEAWTAQQSGLASQNPERAGGRG